MAAIEFISKIKPNSFALLIFIEHLVFNKPTLVLVSQPFNTMHLNGYCRGLLAMFNSAVLKFVTG